MSKKIKTAIIAGAVLLVLVAVALTLFFTRDKNKDAVSEAEVKTVSMIKEDPFTLESAKVKNSTGEYVIELIGEKKWTIKELGELVQKEYMYTDTISEISDVVAGEVVEEDCTDMSKFGLDTPVATLESKYSNGNTYTLELGATAPNGKNQYARLNKTNKVYSISTTTVDSITLDKSAYVEMTVIPALKTDDSGQVSNPYMIDRMYVSRPDLDKPIIIVKMDSKKLATLKVSQSYLVYESPAYGMINEGPAQDYIFGNFGLSAYGIEKVNPTAADFTKLGFDKPSSVLELTYNETNNVKIKTGNPIYAEDKTTIEGYYLYVEGTPEIFKVKADSMKWMTMKPNAVLSTMPVLPYLLDVENLTVTTGSDVSKVGFKLGSDATDVKGVTATLNGKDTDVNRAKSLLGLVTSTYIEDFTSVAPKGNAVCEISYKYRDGTTDVLKVYVNADGSEIITLNDKNMYKARSGFAKKLAAENKNMLAGKDINQDW